MTTQLTHKKKIKKTKKISIAKKKNKITKRTAENQAANNRTANTNRADAPVLGASGRPVLPH